MRLPCEYIEEDVQRMSLMKRFAEAQDMRVVRALEDEMRDRAVFYKAVSDEIASVETLRSRTASGKISELIRAAVRFGRRRPGTTRS